MVPSPLPNEPSQYQVVLAPTTFEKLIALTVPDTGKKEGCANLSGHEWKTIITKALNEYENTTGKIKHQWSTF